jgi:uncharacterized protein (DUF2267 family)
MTFSIYRRKNRKEQRMDNKDLYNNAVKAIFKLFEDENVSIEQCRDVLKMLIEEIEMLIDSLPEDE